MKAHLRQSINTCWIELNLTETHAFSVFWLIQVCSCDSFYLISRTISTDTQYRAGNQGFWKQNFTRFADQPIYSSLPALKASQSFLREEKIDISEGPMDFFFLREILVENWKNYTRCGTLIDRWKNLNCSEWEKKASFSKCRGEAAQSTFIFAECDWILSATQGKTEVLTGLVLSWLSATINTPCCIIIKPLRFLCSYYFKIPLSDQKM